MSESDLTLCISLLYQYADELEKSGQDEDKLIAARMLAVRLLIERHTRSKTTYD